MHQNRFFADVISIKILNLEVIYLNRAFKQLMLYLLYYYIFTVYHFIESIAIGNIKISAKKGEIFSVKVGREYRVAKTTVMEFIQDRRTPDGYQKCVGSVTSNPGGGQTGFCRIS